MPRLVLPEGRARILAIPRGYCKGYFAKNPKLTVKAVIAKRHPPPQGPSKPQPRRQPRNKSIPSPFPVASYRAETVLLFFHPAKPCVENPTIYCRPGSSPPSTATTTSANNTKPPHTAEARTHTPLSTPQGKLSDRSQPELQQPARHLWQHHQIACKKKGRRSDPFPSP